MSANPKGEARNPGDLRRAMDLQRVWAVLVTELRTIVRDRRAFLTAVVLPILLYPVMFLAMDVMEKSSDKRLEDKTHQVALDLRQLGPELGQRLRDALTAEDLNLELVDASPLALQATLKPNPTADQVLLEKSAALAVAKAPLDEGALPVLEIFEDGGDTDSQVAARRLQSAANGLSESIQREVVLASLTRDPADLVDTKEVDLAPAEDTAGHELGKLLPLIAVLVLVSSASFASLSAFAGERESGTLETLLVQPVPGVTLATGKMAAIALVGCLALAGNALSFLGSTAAGLGNLRGFSGDAFGAGAGRVGLGLALVLPTALLLCAATALVSARARTFREGQNLILPLTLFTAALAAPVSVDRVQLDPLLALIPVTGGALAFRDALSGGLRFLPACIAFLASSAWALLLIRKVGGLLDAERLLRSADVSGEIAARKIQSRRALAWGFASILLIYVVGGWLQSQSLVFGLVLTLWGLALGLAFLAARGTACRADESIADTLWLHPPRALHLLAAACLAPGLSLAVSWIATKQSQFLPIPQLQGEFVEVLGGLSIWSSLLLIAVSPGICEELLFRGAILSGLRRDLSAPKVIGWQALMFGLVHASIYRFLPTSLVGGLLAAVTLRVRSIWPAILLHAGYNGLLVSGVIDNPPTWFPLLCAAASVLGLAFLGLPSKQPGSDSNQRH